MKKNSSVSLVNEGVFVIKKLSPYLRNSWVSVVISTVAMLVATGITIAIGQGARVVIDEIPKNSIDASRFFDRALLITVVALFFLGISRYLQSYHTRKVGVKVAEQIRNDIFKKIIGHELKYLESQTSGDMQTRIVADTTVISNFLSNQIPVLTSSFFYGVGGLIGAFLISSKLTIIVLVGVPFVFLPFFVLQKPLRKFGRQVQAAIAGAGAFAGEKFRSVKIIQAFDKEKDENDRFSLLTKNIAGLTLKAARLQLIITILVTNLAYFGFATLLWFSAKDILSGTLSVGQLVGFGYYAVVIIQSAGSLVGIVSSLNVVIGKSEKLIEYLDLQTSEDQIMINEPLQLKKIEFKNVHFHYPSRQNTAVLKGIDLVVEAGAQISIVGSSGSGKSTLFDLLLGFYRPLQGSILIEDNQLGSVDMYLLLRSVRRLIGLVPQKENLVSGTVKDNIAYGAKNISDYDIEKAATLANADEFIRQLPHGYATDLGEVGDKLSGGQKQRISLARALARDPQILLLDEAKSALDAESEKNVSNAIKQWANSNNKTVITITHRISSARDADLIIVLDQGEIVDRGNHETLMNSCQTYRNLVLADQDSTSVDQDPVLAVL